MLVFKTLNDFKTKRLFKNNSISEYNSWVLKTVKHSVIVSCSKQFDIVLRSKASN